MKRLYFVILCALCTLSVSSQTIGEAFYIYRNDGKFNAFFREEIDSIVYSCYDADSLLHDDAVTQVIYTQDSIYRISLAAIDSVGFVTPETKYQPHVIVIDGELRNYVTSSEGLSISFKPDIPSKLLPSVGDKLVTTEVSETFFAGFAGKVESITSESGSIVVTCSAVDLSEVFEELYIVNDSRASKKQVKGETENRRITNSWEGIYSPTPLTFPLTAPIAGQFKKDKDGDLTYEVETEASVSIAPTYYGKVVMIVSPRLGTVLSIDLSEEDKVTEDLKFSGAVDWTHDFTPGPIPVFNLGVPFLYFYAEVGAFFRANASISMEQHWQQKFRYTFHYEVSSSTLFIPRTSFTCLSPSCEHRGEVLVKGEVGIGVFAELGVVFMSKSLLSAGGRAEAGIKVGGNVMLYKKEMEQALHSTTLYKQLQGNKIYLNTFWNVGLQSQWLHWGASHQLDALSGEKELARFSIVPDFSDVKLVRNKDDQSILQASAKVSGACLPQDLGFTLYEREKQEDGQTVMSRYGYIGTSADIYASYFNMPKDKRYEVYPTIKLFGMDALTILADPKGEEEDDLCPDDNHPHWIDMGLPSGTLWRCCNEGASAPEEYGGYYSFALFPSAPSHDQMKELLDHTTSVWTTQNGVNGRKFTGPNGGTIFLPAAGFRTEDGEFSNVGTYGVYWPSLPATYGQYVFYILAFNSDIACRDVYIVNIDNQFSVRPVR